MPGFEPGTSSLPRKRSTPELHRQSQGGAGNEARTRDPDLGRVVLYQLSYSRIPPKELSLRLQYVVERGGERRIRTSEVVRQQIYSLPQLATLVSPR